jgi:hypothetical protein
VTEPDLKAVEFDPGIITVRWLCPTEHWGKIFNMTPHINLEEFSSILAQ